MSTTTSKPSKPKMGEPPMELVAEVARVASLESVQCRAIRAALLVDDVSNGLPLHATVTNEVRYRTESGKLYVRAKSQMVGAYAFGEKKVDVVTAEAEFELLYILGAGDEPSQEACEAFASVNGLYNAWPFIREAFFTESARLGVAPFVLGLRKIEKPQADKDEADEG